VASLSALRLAELIGSLLPPGVFNIATGGREAGAVLASHPAVAMVTLIGSVPTGRAVMRAASDTLKPVLLELGGKNALIAFPDADPDEVAKAITSGMNFTWCGQSCGSTSRAFVHEAIHDKVLERLKTHIAYYKPGIPTDPATTMGAIINKAQYDKVLSYIDIAKSEGATLFYGGKRPDDPKLAKGYFVEPTVFTKVSQTMRIAREEVFGPILSMLSWTDEAAMMADVNSVEYGLTCSIWSNDLNAAHRAAQRVQVGFVWINETAKHFIGTPFGGFKQSGIGREECLGELLSFTREKNIHIRLQT
jgi:betaine-aldehyde dehydrogenase